MASGENWAGWFDADGGWLRAQLQNGDLYHSGLRYEEWGRDELINCHYRQGRYDSPQLTLVGDRALFVDWDKKRFRLVAFKGPGQECLLEESRSLHDNFIIQFDAVAISGDQATIVVPHAPGEPREPVRFWVWSAKTAKLVREISYAPRESHPGMSTLATVSRNGSYVVAAVRAMESAYVLGVREGKQLHRCKTDGAVYHLAASPTADRFACWLDGGVEVWGMAEGKQLASFTDDPQNYPEGAVGLAFSPDGTRLVWGDRVIRVVRVPAAP